MDSTILDKTFNELSEHYESVLILVSTHEDDKTVFKQRRSGNVFSAQAMARRFVKTFENRELAEEIVHCEEDSDE